MAIASLVDSLNQLIQRASDNFVLYTSSYPVKLITIASPHLNPFNTFKLFSIIQINNIIRSE